MRRALLVALVVALAAPGTAAASDCRSHTDGTSYAWQATYGRLAPSVEGLARQASGPQYSGFAADNELEGFAIGIVPGPVSLAKVRRAVLAGLAPADADYLRTRLDVYRELYSRDELGRVASAIGQLQVRGSVGVGCSTSPDRRVQVGIPWTATPEQVQRELSVLAPFGDLVAVRLFENVACTTGTAGPGCPQRPYTVPPAPVALPQPRYLSTGCKVRVLAAARPLVRRATVGGKRVPLRLRPGSERIATVLLRDGGFARVRVCA